MPQFDFTNWSILVSVVFFSYLTIYLWFTRFLSVKIIRYSKVQNKIMID